MCVSYSENFKVHLSDAELETIPLTLVGGSFYSLEGPPDRTYCVEAAVFSLPVP